MDWQLLPSEQREGGRADGVSGAEQAWAEGLTTPPHPAPLGSHPHTQLLVPLPVGASGQAIYARLPSLTHVPLHYMIPAQQASRCQQQVMECGRRRRTGRRAAGTGARRARARCRAVG